MDNSSPNTAQPVMPNTPTPAEPIPTTPVVPAGEQPISTQPATVVSESPIPQRKNPKKLFIVLLLVLVLSAIGVGVYLYFQSQKTTQPPTVSNIPTAQPVSPTPNPTAGWEIYSNSIYQVKYPQGLQVKEDEGSVLNISKWGPTQTEGTELFDGFSITFQPREISDADLSTYVNAKIEGIKMQDISKVTSGPSLITLNNYRGLTFVEEGLGTYKIIVIESKEKPIFMEISILVSDPGNLGFQETVDQILSTFKFDD